ncbi:MAG: M23 family metallopeptidase [Ignavibacteriae bacterium]|nr:M23 family metallopeptidase [Ignavibacteriota bacterium]
MGRIFYSTLAIGIAILIVLVSTTSKHKPAVVAHPESAPPNVTPQIDSIRTDLSGYIWPTEADRIITSTFAEYRRLHFHGGIDISTGNGTGFNVYAARSGYVSLIRVSPVGYGKMLYVRHPDGYSTTYAHLQRFNTEIEERVRKEQRARGRYPVEIPCSPNDFPVKKGDLIAYTGETGVGSPHLHFEIRDENLDFVNPLLCRNVVTQDSLHPTIRAISATPLGENSLVNGQWVPARYSARMVEANVFTIIDTIQITGQVGFGINARDKSNGSRFLNGLYSHELFIDDSLICSVTLNRAPSEDAHQIGLYYDWRLIREGKGRFEKLYVDSPNDLHFYHPKTADAGIIHTAAFAEGPHDFRIVSSDISNNRAELTGKLIINHPPRFSIKTSKDGLKVVFDKTEGLRSILVFTRRFGGDFWNKQSITPHQNDHAVDLPTTASNYDIVKVIAENLWGTESRPQFYFQSTPQGSAGRIRLEHEFEKDFIRVLLRAEGDITSPPMMRVYEGTKELNVQFFPLELDQYVATFRPLSSFHGTRRLVASAEVNGAIATTSVEFDLHPISVGEAGTISYDDGKIQILYDSTSVLETVLMRIGKYSRDDAPEIYSLEPYHAVLKKGLTVRMRIDPDTEKQAIYFSQGRSWTMLSSTHDSITNVLVGRITRTLGELAVLVDDEPPSITRIQTSRSRSRRPQISFGFADDLSGVDYNELNMYIDAVPVIPEVDGEHRRAIYQVSEPLERGSHHLTIRLKDKIGNTAEVQQKFTVQ